MEKSKIENIEKATAALEGVAVQVPDPNIIDGLRMIIEGVATSGRPGAAEAAAQLYNDIGFAQSEAIAGKFDSAFNILLMTLGNGTAYIEGRTSTLKAVETAALADAADSGSNSTQSEGTGTPVEVVAGVEAVSPEQAQAAAVEFATAAPVEAASAVSDVAAPVAVDAEAPDTGISDDLAADLRTARAHHRTQAGNGMGTRENSDATHVQVLEERAEATHNFVKALGLSSGGNAQTYVEQVGGAPPEFDSHVARANAQPAQDREVGSFALAA